MTSKVAERKPPQRIVESGKVYRQLFDAEVQLVTSLANSKLNRLTFNGKPNVPVVHAVPPPGLLTERQIKWLKEFPNEPYTENPVVYKFYSEEEKKRCSEPEWSIAGREVCGLPDIVVPAKYGSNIIEKISSNRKQRHDAALEDMFHELGLISTEMEPRIEAASQKLMCRLHEGDNFLGDTLGTIMFDEALETLSMDDLVAVWNSIVTQTPVHKGFVSDFENEMAFLEDVRMEKVRKIFKDASATLEKVGHLTSSDLERLLDKECQLINKTVLANMRAYAVLVTNANFGVVERERKCYVEWLKRVERWKSIHLEHVVNKFSEYMCSDAIVDPPVPSQILQEMIGEQEILNKQRLELINSLKEFKPPLSTKSAVSEWHERLSNVSKQIDKVNQDYFCRLCLEYEVVCQQCIGEIENIRKELVERTICTEMEADAVIKKKCLPLVGKQQRKYEIMLEDMDKSLEVQNTMVLKRLRQLFKFCQNASHIWDLHEIGLAKQEKLLQEKLDEVRTKNDIINHDKEANLDVVIDRMRQGATETMLREHLVKTFQILDAIRSGYDEFHEQQDQVVSTYPDMIQTEISIYDDSVCDFFGVHRQATAKSTKESSETVTTEVGTVFVVKNSDTISRTVDEEDDPDGEDLDIEEMTEARKCLARLSESPKWGDEEEEEEDSDDDDEDDVQCGGDVQSNESCFSLTEVPFQVPDYILMIDIDEGLINEMEKKIRWNILNHLDRWSIEAIERADIVVSAKREELNKELELRVHMHEPRARRAQLDVHNVRAAELVMHSERMARHTKAIEQCMSELQLMFKTMTDDHNKKMEKFQKEIDRLETLFTNSSKSSKMAELQVQLKRSQDKFLDDIRTTTRVFGQHLDSTIQSLHQSNARFAKSFQLFSDGGNFCPAEVDAFRKQLSILAGKIDQCEGSIMGELEGIESKRLDQAMKAAQAFTEKFKYHMVDLVFLEKIAKILTYAQVKIKTEVADSNSQAGNIAHQLSTLEYQIDACKCPNPDKEIVTPEMLTYNINPIFATVHQRSIYLKCLKSAMSSEPSGLSVASLEGSQPQDGQPAVVTNAMTTISRPGKQQGDDASISIIKSILRSQKVIVGPDGSLERPEGIINTESKASLQDATNAGSKSKDKLSKGSAKDLKKIGKSKSEKNSLVSVFGDSADESDQSNFLGRIRIILRDTLNALVALAEPFYKEKLQTRRNITRPELLKDTLEDCTEVFVQKCQSYNTQAKEYCERCVLEFRVQVTRLETLLACVPDCVFDDLVRMAMNDAEMLRNQLRGELSCAMDQNTSTMASHKQELRPSLGHPQQENNLQELCRRENERKEYAGKAILISSQAQQNFFIGNLVPLYLGNTASRDVSYSKKGEVAALKKAQEILEIFAHHCKHLLVQFDGLLTVDEILAAKPLPEKLPANELFRRHKSCLPLEPDSREEVLNVNRGAGCWPGLPIRELWIDIEGHQESLENLPLAAVANAMWSPQADYATTASITTCKTTLGHTSAICARDCAYKKYKDYFFATLECIVYEKEKLLTAEKRWTEHWDKSVEKVKQLYS